jgi:hypothetical protein
MSFKIVRGTLAASVAPAATVAISYPPGTSRGSFAQGVDTYMMLGQDKITEPEGMTLSFGASSVTVTNAGASTWPAGTNFIFQFDEAGDGNAVSRSGVELYDPLSVVLVDLGSPIAGDADGICASQAITAVGVGGLLNGALLSGGVMDLGLTGRNVVAAWTGTAVMTVTGKDIFGATVVESSASGTSFTGKKAFKTVTSVKVSADVTAATIGTGNVLGLPVRLPAAGNIIRELENGATASAGTTVGALASSTKSTATTADVRGTYVPNSTPDGSKGFQLICALPDPAFAGEAQFAG